MDVSSGLWWWMDDVHGSHVSVQADALSAQEGWETLTSHGWGGHVQREVTAEAAQPAQLLLSLTLLKPNAGACVNTYATRRVSPSSQHS